jgi:chaperone BCS1
MFTDNPYFSAGFGLTLMGVAMAGVKSGSQHLISYARKRLLTTLEIRSVDASYGWLIDYLSSTKSLTSPISKTGLLSKVRPLPPDKLSVATLYKTFKNGSASVDFSLHPGVGSYFITYKGAVMHISRSRDSSSSSITRTVPLESLTITSLTSNRYLLSQMLHEAYSFAHEKSAEKVWRFSS